MTAVVDHVRCAVESCRRVFGRSRYMVRRGTVTCPRCARGQPHHSREHMQAIAAKGHASMRATRLAALEPRLATLSKVDCYRLGRDDEFNRMRAQLKRGKSMSEVTPA
jgi:hypothetical protein